LAEKSGEEAIQILLFPPFFGFLPDSEILIAYRDNSQCPDGPMSGQQRDGSGPVTKLERGRKGLPKKILFWYKDIRIRLFFLEGFLWEMACEKKSMK